MPRLPRTLDLPALAPLDREAGHLARQLTQALRTAIRAGQLPAGAPLPSSRQLAAALSVARGTVLEAFEQLKAEGYLEAMPRGATRVAAGLPTDIGPAPAAASRAPSPPLTEQGVHLARLARQFAPLPPVPFAVSVPHGPTAPGDAWRRIGNRVRAGAEAAPAGYASPFGVDRLREQIAAYLRRSRAVVCEPEQVIVTSGTQQGLYLACQVLLGRGDRAWVEDPAYRGITGILEAHAGTGIVRVPVDPEGIDVAAGIAAAPAARVAFVTPSHQYPLGMPMSMARRGALLAWARAHGSWIVEDDYDSELRYVGQPFPSLQGLAPEQVIYLGTFSKMMFPSLRLGYLIAPAAWSAAFAGARGLLDRHTATADQHVLAAYMAEGHFERHIRRVRGVYADCRARLLAALRRRMPSGLAWAQDGDQGMHMVLWLRPGARDVAIADAALAAGVAVRPLSPMYARDGRPGLILGLGGFDDAEIDAALVRLAGVIRAHAS